MIGCFESRNFGRNVYRQSGVGKKLRAHWNDWRQTPFDERAMKGIGPAKRHFQNGQPKLEEEPATQTIFWTSSEFYSWVP